MDVCRQQQQQQHTYLGRYNNDFFPKLFFLFFLSFTLFIFSGENVPFFQPATYGLVSSSLALLPGLLIAVL